MRPVLKSGSHDTTSEQQRSMHLCARTVVSSFPCVMCAEGCRAGMAHCRHSLQSSSSGSDVAELEEPLHIHTLAKALWAATFVRRVFLYVACCPPL
jgi:hypothetical protein